MDHVDVPSFLGLLVLLLGAAKLLGALARRVGQPAVLGELVAGVLVGASVLRLIDPHHANDFKNQALHLFAEIGIVLLLFEIGLETDLARLLRVGGVAAVVALVGVILPFFLGYAACRLFGEPQGVAVVAGAALTATSIGITARVLTDLGQLQSVEGQVILGAAVLDDVIGLIILGVVAKLSADKEVTILAIAWLTVVAFGFLAGILLLGRLIVPLLLRLVERLKLSGGPTILGILLAFGLAWLADAAGSAVIVGALAAGVILGRTGAAPDIRRGVAHLGYFFVPLFFVVVGAAVDVRILNPFAPANRTTLLVGGVLIVAAVVGKFFAGYAPFWFRGRKHVIGIGMIPRGEVGLIFAQMGLIHRVLDSGLYSAITMVVMVTTFMAPPLLRAYFPPLPAGKRPELNNGGAERVGPFLQEGQ